MQVCVLANSVEHVLQYLQELPQQMQWSKVLKDDTDVLTDASLKEQVLRILKLIHESMNRDARDIITRMMNEIVIGIHNNVEKLLISWLQSQMTNQVSYSLKDT